MFELFSRFNGKFISLKKIKIFILILIITSIGNISGQEKFIHTFLNSEFAILYGKITLYSGVVDTSELKVRSDASKVILIDSNRDTEKLKSKLKNVKKASIKNFSNDLIAVIEIHDKGQVKNYLFSFTHFILKDQEGIFEIPTGFLEYYFGESPGDEVIKNWKKKNE